jgi:hypothetical protein
MLNCTEGGAHIAGIDHLSLTEATADFAPFDVKGAIGRADDRHMSVHAVVDFSIDALEHASMIALSCAALADEVGPDLSGLWRLQSKVETLCRVIAPLPLVNILAAAEVNAALGQSRDDMTPADHLKRLRSLFLAIQRAAAFAVPRLCRAAGKKHWR